MLGFFLGVEDRVEYTKDNGVYVLGKGRKEVENMLRYFKWYEDSKVWGGGGWVIVFRMMWECVFARLI